MNLLQEILLELMIFLVLPICHVFLIFKGAKRAGPISLTKNIRHYNERLYGNVNPHQDYMNRNQYRLNHDVIFGTGLRYHQSDHPVKVGKKLYGNIHWASEIGETNAINKGEGG